MAETPAEYLDRVTALLVAAFESVQVIHRDDRVERCLLEMVGQTGAYRVRLLEVVTRNSPRKYAYYVLQGERAIAGFDNAQVRQMKYGADHAAHRYERIPHQHGPDKAAVELTGELACADFIAWVQAHCG